MPLAFGAQALSVITLLCFRFDIYLCGFSPGKFVFFFLLLPLCCIAFAWLGPGLSS